MNAETAANKAAQAQSECMPQREQYWEEASNDIKLDRLRDEVVSLMATVSEQSKIIVALGMHAHGTDGRLMVPMVDNLNTNRALGRIERSEVPYRLRKAHERR